MKAIAALAIIVSAAAIAGCGSSPTATSSHPVTAGQFAASIAENTASTGRAQRPWGAPVQFRAIEYSTAVVDAGLPDGFTAFVTDTRTITVQSSSAATIDTAANGPLTFAAPSDRNRWLAAGSPQLAPAPSAGQTLSMPPGQFSFIPQGSTLTYRQAGALPGTPVSLKDTLLRHMRPNPPATLVFWQIGYLIAVAPLSTSARSAAWYVVASLPGLHRCGPEVDRSGRHGEALCVDAEGRETEILVDAGTGSVLAIEERLLEESPMYPAVPAGTLIESSTFIFP